MTSYDFCPCGLFSNTALSICRTGAGLTSTPVSVRTVCVPAQEGSDNDLKTSVMLPGDVHGQVYVPC